MKAVDRVSRCTFAATIVVCLLTMLQAGSARAAVITKCPTAASLEAAAGVTLKVTSHEKIGFEVLCDYAHVLSKYKQTTIGFSVGPLQFSDATFASNVKASAKSSHAPVITLPGVGDEAFEYTQKASNSTNVFVRVGKKVVNVTSNLPAKNVLAVAKKLI